MNVLAVFLLGFSLGGFCEYSITLFLDLLERKPLRINHKFTVAKKVSLLSLPIWGLIGLLFVKGSYPYVNVFIISALVGTVLEGILGKFIHYFFGVKIWTYKYGSIGNFTSIYSLPYWGAVGVVFGTLGKLMGL